MKILISPYARILPDNKPNPKNFPYWKETIRLIKNKIPDAQIIQTGLESEPIIEGINEVAFNYGPKKLLKLAQESKIGRAHV